MDFRTLRIYLSVCSTLNFSRSAEQLHQSVSAVSRSIARLEEELGEALLLRDRRGMQLTRAGSALRDYAQQVLGDWEQFRQGLATEKGVAGQLRLFCSVTASYRLLSPLLTRFRDAYPLVEVMLQTGDQAEGLPRVLAGDDDAAVVARPRSLPERAEFLEITRTPMVLCAPKVSGSIKPAIEQGMLGGLPFILPERGVTREMIDAWFDETARGAPAVYARVAGHEAILGMVALGLGVGFVPKLVLDSSGVRADVAVVEISPPLPELGVGLCVTRRGLRLPQVAALWEQVRQTMAPDV
jgi:LysR family positive regulator for ilvC